MYKSFTFLGPNIPLVMGPDEIDINSILNKLIFWYSPQTSHKGVCHDLSLQGRKVEACSATVFHSVGINHTIHTLGGLQSLFAILDQYCRLKFSTTGGENHLEDES